MNMRARALILRFILLLCGTVAMAGKENIKYKLKPKSWITDDDFYTLVMLSYPTSICCNIYLSDSTEGVEAVFEQFRKIYPYQYLLKKRIFACQGYFLLGSVESEIIQQLWEIPSTISTTEILIILGHNISNDSALLNVTLYRNGNANVVTPSGVWSLSENYLVPRVFQKINRYEEMLHEQGLINLKGRELQVATTYFPPSCYLKRTVNKTINGVKAHVFLTDDDEERDGVELKLFLLLAEKLNFTWTIREPAGIHQFGHRSSDEIWNTGLIGMVGEGKIDMSFGAIWLTLEHAKYANMSESWYQFYLHFLVPRPRRHTSFWALTRPFSLKVWMVLVTLIFAQSLNLFLHARVNPAYPKHFRHFVVTLTEMTGRMLGGIIPKDAKRCRLQMLMWHVASVLIVTAYSSSLAARLASSEYEARIDTIEQFIEKNLSWGSKDLNPPFNDFFDLSDKYSSQLPKKFIIFNSEEEKEAMIANSKVAIIGNVVDSLVFPDIDLEADHLKNYRVMKEAFGKFYVSFAVQPWLLEPVNKVMHWLKESGIVFFLVRDVLRRRVSFHLREVVIERDRSDGKARVLTLTPLGAGFSVLIVGLLISTCVFYTELKYASGDKPIGELLRTIARKREAYELSKSSGRRRSEDGMENKTHM